MAENFYHIEVIGERSRLSGGVHGPDGASDIDARDIELRRGDITQGATACHIGMIDEILHLDACLIAESMEHCGASAVGHILAVGIDFYDGSTTDDRMIGGVILFIIIRMPSMSIVGRDHERSGESTV